MASYFGTRHIAQRMGWRSPTTPINKHERRDDPNPFPMFLWPRGRNWVWHTSDELIFLWEKREAELSRIQRVARLRLPRRNRRKTLQKDLIDGRRGWTASPFSEEKEAGPTHEAGLPATYEEPRRTRSLPTRIADEHFHRRMRSGRTRRQ